MRLAIAVTSESTILPTVETTNRVTLIRLSRVVGKLEISCALQIENNLVNGVEISESGTSTASSQSIDRKGDIRTSAQQKDEHTKESAKDPPLTASSLVLFTFIPVSAYGAEFAQIACCLEAPQW